MRERAKKKVKAEETIYTTAIIFSGTTVVLLMLGFYIPSIAIWLTLPIPLFVMILGVMYVSAFGFSFTKTMSTDWREEEIEREMARMSLEKRARERPVEEPAEPLNLELKEFETLESSANDEDYV